MKRALTVLSIVAIAGMSIACGTGDDDTPASTTGDSNAEQVDADTAGTRDNPYAAGDTIELDEWEVTLAKTDKDATEDVLAENQFNADELGDATAVMVEVATKYTGKESGMAGLDVRLALVGGDGNTYDTSNGYCGVIPEPLTNAGEQYTDAETTGNVCVAIKDTDVIDGATWKITEGLGKNEVFVALK